MLTNCCTVTLLPHNHMTFREGRKINWSGGSQLERESYDFFFCLDEGRIKYFCEDMGESLTVAPI